MVKESQDLKLHRYVVQVAAFFLSVGEEEKGV